MDYYNEAVADLELAKVPGATLTKVDVRTGLPIA